MLAIKRRRMEALRRHQGLWSQCWSGSIVGERGEDGRGGDEVCGFWCGFESAGVGWACGKTVLVSDGSGVEVSWIDFEEVTPDFRKGREDSW